jgi:hypothetical protein
MFLLFLKGGEVDVEFFLFLGCDLFLALDSGPDGFLELLLLLLSVALLFLLFSCIDEVLGFIDQIQDFTIGGHSDNLNVPDFSEVVAEFSQVFPLGMVEF